MAATVISIQNLTKTYQLGVIGTGTFRGDLQRWWAKVRGNPDPTLKIGQIEDTHRPGETIWALKNINLEISRGEAVGIIGRNGAGKSTLLKILSRVTAPSSGQVRIKGRIASLLEVGTGFHPELTGRENIYLNGAILGMDRKEIARKFDEILDFSGIEKFVDTPVKRYSSGMYVRLAFAVSAHLEPDILVVDEVLAVGDAEFQKKCLGKMGDVTSDGRTVLFVSHNMAAISSICNRAILLDKGTISLDGPAEVVTNHYLSQNLPAELSHLEFEQDDNLRVQLLEVTLTHTLDEAGRAISFLQCKYLVREPLDNLLLCVDVQNMMGTSVYYSNDGQLADERKRQAGVHAVELYIPRYLFAPGTYTVAFGFWEPGHPAEHFPKEKLTFYIPHPINQLAVHGVSWPSIIYLPNMWKYVQSELEDENEKT